MPLKAWQANLSCYGGGREGIQHFQEYLCENETRTSAFDLDTPITTFIYDHHYVTNAYTHIHVGERRAFLNCINFSSRPNLQVLDQALWGNIFYIFHSTFTIFPLISRFCSLASPLLPIHTKVYAIGMRFCRILFFFSTALLKDQ